MGSSPFVSSRHGQVALVLALPLLLALALRWQGLLTYGLWLDEIYGATFTNLGLADLLVAVLRFDVHPPLYYLQLNAWAGVFGHSDAALLSNSVVWSLGGLLVLGLSALRWFSVSVAVLAALLLAVSRGDIHYAQQLRMYSMMTALVLIGWWIAARSNEPLGEDKQRWFDWAFVAVLAAIGLCNGASVIPVSALALYRLLSLHHAKRLNKRTFLQMAVVMVLILGPVLLNSSLRSTSHGASLGFAAIVDTVSNWLWADEYSNSASRHLAFAVAVLVVVGGIAFGTATRHITLAFVVYPLLAGALLSLLVRPIWIDRLFAFCVPFFALVTAILVVRLHALACRARRASWIGTATLGSAMAAVLAAALANEFESKQRPRKMEYREVAAHLRAHASPTSVIYAPDFTTFWGIARYWATPQWGNLKEIQDPARTSGTSDVWANIYKKIGPEWIRILGLTPKTRVLEKDGQRLVIGWSPDTLLSNGPDLWVVSGPRTRLEDLPICWGQADVQHFRGLQLFHVRCSP